MRNGTALPMALFTLSLVGALAIGGAWTARRAAEDARGDRAAQDLDRLTQDALAGLVASWDSIRSHQPLGVPVVTVEPTELGKLVVTSTRVGPSAHWVVLEAFGLVKPFAHNKIGILIAADSAGVVVAPQAAIVRLP